MDNDLRTVLVRAVLDDAFRARLQADPASALEGFALSPKDRAALSSGDGLLDLLGKALGTPSLDEPAARVAQPAPIPPASRVVLTVSPQRHPRPDGGSTLQHAVSVHPWPPPASSAAAFVVSFHPIDHDGTVTYSATIAPVGPAPAPVAANPWATDLDRPEIHDAIAAVHDAMPDARYDRLVDLVRRASQ